MRLNPWRTYHGTSGLICGRSGKLETPHLLSSRDNLDGYSPLPNKDRAWCIYLPFSPQFCPVYHSLSGWGICRRCIRRGWCNTSRHGCIWWHWIIRRIRLISRSIPVWIVWWNFFASHSNAYCQHEGCSNYCRQNYTCFHHFLFGGIVGLIWLIWWSIFPSVCRIRIEGRSGDAPTEDYEHNRHQNSQLIFHSGNSLPHHSCPWNYLRIWPNSDSNLAKSNSKWTSIMRLSGGSPMNYCTLKIAGPGGPINER